MVHIVTIKSNDPARPELVLTLFLTAWLGVRISPQSVDFGSLLAGSRAEGVVQLFSPDSKSFRVVAVSSDLREIHALIAAPDADLPVHRIHVEIHAGEGIGAIRGSVFVNTDRKDARCLVIPISARVEGPLVVSPSTIRIERGEIGKIVSRKLLIRSFSPKDELVLSKVEAIAPWELRSYSTHRLNGSLSSLEVAILFPEGDGAESGELLLSFSKPKVKSYRVPLTIRGWTPPLPAGS